MMFITKKRLIKEALKIYMEYETADSQYIFGLDYCFGNANALNGLFSRLKIKDWASAKEKAMRCIVPPKGE